MSPSFLPLGLVYFSGREPWGLWAVETRPRGSWPIDLSVWDEIWCGGVEMVWDGWLVNGYGWCGGECVKKTGNYYYITNVIYFSCAKDANHSQILGSPDPLFIFSTKAYRCWPWPAHIWRCADFLLLRDADFRRIRRSRAYAQVWFGDGIYAALRQLWWCPWRRSLHSIVFR